MTTRVFFAFVISATSVLVGLGASAAPLFTDQNEWVPSGAFVAEADAQTLQFELPNEFGSIKSYVRYYWGTVRDARRVVEGLAVSPSVERTDGHPFSHQVNIVAEIDAPAFVDGGCMFVYVDYDVEAHKLMQIHCNPDGPRPPPPPPQ